jgi:NADPH:quinone reductase-like Zn-dependent oxidoreductase
MTMRTVLYNRYGAGADVLEVDTVPSPAAPGPNEIAIRVLARPVHHGDLLGVAGRYRSPGDFSEVPPGGKRPGFEGMGVIQTIGADVPATSGFAEGDRVAFFPVLGAWGEEVCAPAQFVTRLDDRISDEIGAQLHVNPLTALMLLRAAAQAGVTAEGGAVVVTAAGSAVAKLAIAFARERGWKVVAVVRRAAGRDDLNAVFPDLAVVDTETPDWLDRARRAIDGKPVRVVLDPVGGETASQAFSLLENGGALISYGDLTDAPITLPALPFSTRDLAVRGVSVGGWARLSEEIRAQDLQDVARLAIRSPDLFPIAATYDLKDVRLAAAHVHRVGKAGSVLLTSRQARSPD